MTYSLRLKPDPILRTMCKKVEDFSELDSLVNYMKSFLFNGGAGIAAPQVGDDRQVIIAKIDGVSQVFVNPKILDSRGYRVKSEGCFSLPGKTYLKIRKRTIDLEYQDIKGDEKRGIYTGLNSVILQHEIDHLNGKLISD